MFAYRDSAFSLALFSRLFLRFGSFLFLLFPTTLFLFFKYHLVQPLTPPVRASDAESWSIDVRHRFLTSFFSLHFMAFFSRLFFFGFPSLFWS